MIRTSTFPRWISGLGVLGSVLVIPLHAQQIPTVRPRAGMVITRSVRIAPGTYRLPAPGGDSALITIRGDGIVVDARGVTLDGSPAGTDPDQRAGLAVWVDGGHGVTLKGARIRGYQTAIRATGTVDLTLLDNDLSDNWRPRLFSLVGHESLIDWLSFHHNENGEWRRFGAGIALEGVHRGLLRGNTVRHGMNGLMLTRTDSLRIDRNDYSFNSGVGIGLYRATDNVIVRNRVDYNVRGYSPYFRRGQDSADLLMFEQSSRNVVAWNSMTHGGDGLFLWAGQTTMDTGAGGSNNNFFAENDFSYAPTNGMEATFSTNLFAHNRVVGNENGLWAGYSFASPITGNCFARNRVGIAIEHGWLNDIIANSFHGDSTAIFLWADPIQPSDWGYPKHHDTRSRDWTINRNTFSGHRVGLRIRQTEGLETHRNSFDHVDTIATMRDTSDMTLEPPIILAGTDTSGCEVIPRSEEPLSAHFDVGEPAAAPTTPLARRDRRAIVVDEWGPYDWSTPKLWPVDSFRDSAFRLQVLGLPGTWRVASMRGLASLSARSGRVGDTLVVTPRAGSTGDWRVELTDGRHRFAHDHFEPIPGWDTRYFAWTDSSSWSSMPLLAHHEPRLDLMWYRPTIAGLPQAHWALEATTSVDLPPGEYTLRTISDDAVQVWVDGTLLIDHWDPHESLVDNAAIPAGHHDLRVRYLQVEGWVELRVEIVRGRVRSQGSPGPH